MQTYSIRPVIQFINPLPEEYLPTVQQMEKSFKKITYSLGAPIEELTIHHQEPYLPNYYLHSGDDCPALIMIGGRDTYREDLFYLAGYPGQKRGYDVLIINLPGQGSSPNRELTFDVNAVTPISLYIDWLENKNPKLNHLAAYDVSGGGYFTAQAVKQGIRIQVWTVSIPIYDIAEIFRKEFGSSLKVPSWLMNAISGSAENLNRPAGSNLQKYAWQFRTTGFKKAIGEVLKRTKVVNYQKVQCPCLLIVGEGEGVKLQRQVKVVYEAIKSENSHTRLQIFKAESGADAHCQVDSSRFIYDIVSN